MLNNQRNKTILLVSIVFNSLVCFYTSIGGLTNVHEVVKPLLAFLVLKLLTQQRE